MNDKPDYQHFDLERSDQALVICLHGPKMLDRERYPYHELHEELRLLLEDEAEHGVVLDFSQVVAIDTLAVQALVGLWKRLKSHGRELSLCGLHDVTLQIMKLVRFDLLFVFHETRAAAVEAVRQVGPPSGEKDTKDLI